MWVRRLGVVSVVAVILLMALGAWVKATRSGAACPDWPACYGEWLPPFPSMEAGGTDGVVPSDANGWASDPADTYTQAQVLYEWAHRLLASLSFIPVLLFAFLAATTKRFTKALRVLPAVAMGLYLFQALLGGLTVVLRPANPPWATTWHLVNAILLLVVLVIATCHAYLVRQAAPVVIRKFSFTPSVHAARGYTYPDGRNSAAERQPREPQGPFPGETEERHG